MRWQASLNTSPENTSHQQGQIALPSSAASLPALQLSRMVHGNWLTCLLYTSPSPRDAHES
eukprot:3320620-Prymnesium_polylepis.1